jgi:hypothetical protein
LTPSLLSSSAARQARRIKPFYSSTPFSQKAFGQKTAGQQMQDKKDTCQLMSF